MLLDMLAAVARTDYDDRLRRQRQGIEKAKGERRYQGKAIDQDKHKCIQACLIRGMSIRETAEATGTSTSIVIGLRRSRNMLRWASDKSRCSGFLKALGRLAEYLRLSHVWQFSAPY